MNDPLIIAAQRELERARAEIRKPALAHLFAPENFGRLWGINQRDADLRLVLAAYRGAPRALRRTLEPAMKQAITSLRRALA